MGPFDLRVFGHRRLLAVRTRDRALGSLVVLKIDVLGCDYGDLFPFACPEG